MSTPQRAEVRVYHRPISTWWWLRKRSYFVFVMRELSSIFVAWFVGYLIALVYAVGRSDAAYQDFLDWAATPWVVVLNVVARPSSCCTSSPGSASPPRRWTCGFAARRRLRH